MPRPSATPEHFARLIPRNESALLCFDDVCNTIDSRGSRYKHHNGQILRNNDKKSLQAVLLPHTSRESSVASDATTESGITVDRQVWTGCYLLTPLGPSEHDKGWRIGHGRKWETSANGQVDILLAMRGEYRLRGLHAYMYFGETGVLLIRAKTRQSILRVDHHDISTMTEGLALIGKDSFLISFGSLQYELQYTTSAATQYSRMQRQYYREMRYPPRAILSDLSTLTENNTSVGEWVITKTLAHTYHGTLREATCRRGGSVAMVKTINRDSSNHDTVDNQIALWQKITQDLSNKDGNSHIVTLVEVFHGETSRQEGDSIINLLLNSQMLYNMGQIGALRGTGSALSEKKLLTLFYQVVKGIAALHNAGWIHRNITLASVGVSSINPPHAIIMDLEDAVALQPGDWLQTPTFCGAPNYRAPELETYNSWYNGGVDVWAAGCLGVEILFNEVSWKAPFNIWIDLAPFHSDYQSAQSKQQIFWKMHSHMQSFPQNTLPNILASMLTFDAQSRPTIFDLLGPLEVALNGMR